MLTNAVPAAVRRGLALLADLLVMALSLFLLVLRDAPNDKFAYFAMFETDEASWAGVRAVFQDAGRHLLVKPRAIQGPEQVAAPPKKEEPPPDPPKKKSKKKTAG